MFEHIIAIGAHVDDIEVGAAGMLHSLIKNNDVSTVDVVFFTPPANVEIASGGKFTAEFMAAMQAWGFKWEVNKGFKMHYHSTPVREFHNYRSDIREYLYELNETIKPDTVLVPSRQEFHQDHQVVTEETIRIFRKSTVLGYEMPMISLSIESVMYYPLEDEDIQAKTAACAAYESQSFRASMQPGIMEALAKLRGNQIGREFAEAYEVIRWIQM